MSIPVALSDLDTTLVDFPWGYLVTIGDQRAHTLAVPTRFVDGVFVAPIGRTPRQNIATRPAVTMMFPGATGGDYSLVIDGAGELAGDDIRVTPTGAVLHRPALGDD